MDWSNKTRGQLLEELERCQDRLRDAGSIASILEQSSQPFAVGTTDGRLTRVNSAFCTLTGYTAEELLGDISWTETLTAPAWRGRDVDALQQIASGEGTVRFEKEYTTKTGERVPVELLAQRTPDSDLVYAFVTDITARKQQQSERERSEERYRQLIEDLPSGVVHVSMAGEIALANKEAQRILGLSFDAMTERYVNDWEGDTLREDGSVCPVDEYPVSKCLMSGKAQGPTIVGVRRPDGQVSWALFSAHPELEAGVLVGAVVAFRDITDWRRAEESVRLLSTVIEQSAISVMMTDRNGKIVYVNPAFTQRTGYSSEEALGQNPRFLSSGIHPRGFYEELWNTVLAGDTWRHDICNSTKTGELYWELMTISPIRGFDGEIRHLVAMKVDDTERKLAVEALGKSEERFQIVTQTAHDPIIALDEQDRIAVWNPAATRVFGYGVDEALGRPVNELNLFASAALSSGSDDREVDGGDTIETLARRKDGTEFPAEISVARVQRGGGWSRTAIVRDTTERKRLERELLRISKLESVGVLAGGIAHDFNNILTSIIANLSIASYKLDADAPVRKILAAANESAQRATGLTRQLLTFSRGGAPITSLISLGFLADSADFVFRGSNVRCDVDFPVDLWLVDADSGQLEQVIQNLLINANHAMPDGGVVRMCARNRTLTANEIPVLRAGPYVEITVADRGCGIPTEHLDRIFDPYFTTKQTGSGLGLATAFSVIKNHHGDLMVSSELGAGTTFSIFLPAKTDAVSKPARREDMDRRARTGRIMVMDDDAGVRTAAASSLREFGYDVDVAEDGAQAISRYREAMRSGRPYQVVIVDLTVPGGLGGLPTLAGLKEIDPRICAIVSSGYSDDPVMANPERFGFCGVVAKPFTPDALAQVVETCLTRDPSKS